MSSFEGTGINVISVSKSHSLSSLIHLSFRLIIEYSFGEYIGIYFLHTPLGLEVLRWAGNSPT
jgi:hypothetical protein